jgi:hypothetical protein
MEVMKKKTKTAKKSSPLAAYEARLEELRHARKTDDIYMIAVPTNDEATEWTAAYIRKPSRQTVASAVSLTQQGKALEASAVVLNEEWIEGDKSIIDDDELFYSAHVTMQDMIRFRVGVLKKK